MATAHDRDGRLFVAVKGAPEAVLALSTATGEEKAALGNEEREEWLHRAEALAEDGLRVLALAEKTIPSNTLPNYEGLVFLGLVGFRDPPRVEVKQAIADCRQAGIRVVMVTGDHAVTARKIAEHVGIVEPGNCILVEGRELEALGALGEQGHRRVLTAQVFARVTPAQKLELVLLYQNAGEVVAMTGDGVNDAPALQKANIGVAMGLRGTEVAREAADIVLRDDAFNSIVAAICEGRIIFSNLRRFLVYLLSCNISEVMVVALAVVSGLPLPLLPLQILFLNLVTDVFPAFALATGEGEEDVLRRPPRNPREPLLGRPQWLFIAGFGALLTASTLSSLVVGHYWLELHGEALVTVSFLTLAFAQLWHVFNMRGRGSGILRNAVTSNPYVWMALVLCTAILLLAIYAPPLATALQIVPPDRAGWTLVMAASLAPLLLGMLAGAFTAFFQARLRQVRTGVDCKRPTRLRGKKGCGKKLWNQHSQSMEQPPRLANQVAELRKRVEARLAATKPRPRLQIIFDKGTSDAEIERLRAETAAEAGVDPARVERWIHYTIVYPPPRR